jgi:hypothetical protein
MQLSPTASTHPKPPPGLHAPWSAAGLPGQPSDAQFGAIAVACRASGGLARGDELACQLEERGYGDFTSLARQIVAREVFSFRWQDDFWVPLFQFDAERGMAVKPALAGILAALGPWLDGAQLAAWFTQANPHLEGHAPADRLDGDAAGVLRAATAS